MKKASILLFLTLGVGIGLVSGCMGNRQSKEYADAQGTEPAQSPDSAFYGHLGEGTGMSCLELVTEEGDTLVLNKVDEKTGNYGLILGEIANYTDRFAITTVDDDQNVLVALNVTQLERSWQSVADSLKGFRLMPDGKAAALKDVGHRYDAWSLYNCMLVLQTGRQETQDASTGCDTLRILKLTPDSLILQSAENGSPERFYSVK